MKITIENACSFCGVISAIKVEKDHYFNWTAGQLAQKAFPELSASQREILISGICKDCQKRIFQINLKATRIKLNEKGLIRMKVVYFADDGTQFEDEYDCEEYERKCAYERAAIVGLDEKGQEISYSDEDFCIDVFTLNLTNEEDVNLFINRCRDEGYSFYAKGINGPGIYFRNINEYKDLPEWELIDSIISVCQEKMNKMKKYKKAVQK